MSGGVDSAVSAALLQEQGYNVIGVFIKIWQPEFLECTWKEDRLDAMRVTAALGIPLREIDLSREYKKDVVDTMVSEYARGITPNPDILCNRHIKFGSFAQWARAEGADHIATGHYARVRENSGSFDLLRAVDTNKDQSYFLYRLGQEDLARAIFPIGGMLKSEVRAQAIRRKLPVANKADSQGLCFVGQVSMPEFLGRFIALTKGPVVADGKVVGEHGGAALYTVGQRHGFTTEMSESTVPHYVIGINIAKNTIFVSANRDNAASDSVYLEAVHWINRAPELPATLSIQARYREQPVFAHVSVHDGKTLVEFEKPHIASAGQALVMYDGDVCIGGGTISPRQ